MKVSSSVRSNRMLVSSMTVDPFAPAAKESSIRYRTRSRDTCQRKNTQKQHCGIKIAGESGAVKKITDEKETRKLRKLFILFAVGTSIVTCAGVEAMPLNAHIVSSGGVFTPVNSECGIGVHRGPYDRC